MEEIITVNGQQYELELSSPLTQAQRNDVIRQISIQSKTTQTVGCSSCGSQQKSNSSINSLTTTCTTNPIKTGTTKDIPCTIDNPSNLTPGYVYKLYTYGTLYGTYPTSGTTTSTSHTFSGVPFNTVGTAVAVKLEVTDSCQGNVVGSTTCNVLVQDPTLTTVSVTDPNICKSTITIAGTCQLGYTCIDQFGSAITCTTPTWTTTNGTGSVSVSSTGLVTGITVGTATVTATTGGKSGQTTVTVIASCTPPTCSFTI